MKQGNENKAIWLYGKHLTPEFCNNMIQSFESARLRLKNHLRECVDSDESPDDQTDDIVFSIRWYDERIAEFREAKTKLLSIYNGN